MTTDRNYKQTKAARETEKLRSLCRKLSKELVDEAHRIATQGKFDSDRLRAVEILLAYGIGKPTQILEVAGSVSGTITHKVDVPPQETFEQWQVRQQKKIEDQKKLSV